MPIEPWWETNPATTPRQELGMVSPELLLSVELLEREKDFELVDRIKRISPMSWKRVGNHSRWGSDRVFNQLKTRSEPKSRL